MGLWYRFSCGSFAVWEYWRSGSLVWACVLSRLVNVHSFRGTRQPLTTQLYTEYQILTAKARSVFLVCSTVEENKLCCDHWCVFDEHILLFSDSLMNDKICCSRMCAHVNRWWWVERFWIETVAGVSIQYNTSTTWMLSSAKDSSLRKLLWLLKSTAEEQRWGSMKQTNARLSFFRNNLDAVRHFLVIWSASTPTSRVAISHGFRTVWSDTCCLVSPFEGVAYPIRYDTITKAKSFSEQLPDISLYETRWHSLSTRVLSPKFKL